MKLEDTIVIVGNQGELKVFKINKYERTIKGEIKIDYNLETLNTLDYIDSHKKLQDIVTDQAGRFGDNTDEEHELENERKKKVLKEIAEDIDSINTKLKPTRVFLSFTKEYMPKLLDELSKESKEVLMKTIPLDLVKTPQDKILEYFLDE
jgi:hypothetical protein